MLAQWYGLKSYQRYGYARFVGVLVIIGLLTAMLYQHGRA